MGGVKESVKNRGNPITVVMRNMWSAVISPQSVNQQREYTLDHAAKGGAGFPAGVLTWERDKLTTKDL